MINDARVLTRKHLETLTPKWDTAYEGENFTPTDDWQEVILLSGNNERFTLEKTQRNFILQINVYTFANIGTYKVEKRVELLEEHYKGIKLENDKICLQATKTDIKNLGKQDKYIVRVLSVYFKARSK